MGCCLSRCTGGGRSCSDMHYEYNALVRVWEFWTSCFGRRRRRGAAGAEVDEWCRCPQAEGYMSVQKTSRPRLCSAQRFLSRPRHSRAYCLATYCATRASGAVAEPGWLSTADTPCIQCTSTDTIRTVLGFRQGLGFLSRTRHSSHITDEALGFRVLSSDDELTSPRGPPNSHCQQGHGKLVASRTMRSAAEIRGRQHMSGKPVAASGRFHNLDVRNSNWIGDPWMI